MSSECHCYADTQTFPQIILNGGGGKEIYPLDLHGLSSKV